MKLSSGDSTPPAVKEYTDDQKQDYMELFGTSSAEDVTSHVGGNPESVAVRAKETSAALMALIMKNRKRKHYKTILQRKRMTKVHTIHADRHCLWTPSERAKNLNNKNRGVD